jgi:hypothetical protein
MGRYGHRRDGVSRLMVGSLLPIVLGYGVGVVPSQRFLFVDQGRGTCWAVRYVGMDVHREFAQPAVVEDCLVRDEGRIAVTPEALRRWLLSSAPMMRLLWRPREQRCNREPADADRWPGGGVESGEDTGDIRTCSTRVHWPDAPATATQATQFSKPLDR